MEQESSDFASVQNRARQQLSGFMNKSLEFILSFREQRIRRVKLR